jgi:uncharacterized protein involved in exopolysaccharide biosynthesis
MQYQLEKPQTTAVFRPQQAGPRELLAVIIRRRWIILGVALPIIVIAAVGTLRSADVVTAGSRVMIMARQPESPTFDNVNVDYTMLMSSAAQMAMSIPVAEKAAQALEDSVPNLAQIDPTLAHVRNPQDLRDVLLSGVDCTQVGESNILNLAYRHASPRFALMAVGAITKAYIEFNVETQQNRQALDYYDEQIAAVEAEIDTLMSQRAAFRDRAGYSAFAANAQTGIAQIFTLEHELVRARSRREGLQAKLDGLLSAVAADSDYVPSFKAGESAILLGLKNRYEDLRAKLDEMRIQYTDDSEWVRRQRLLIVEAGVAFRRERDSYIQDVRIELAEARQAEAAFQRAMDRATATIEDYPQVEAKVEALDMRVSTQRDLLKNLQLKRGEVRMKALSDSRISSVVLLNAPDIESVVARGKKMLYLSLASVFAVVLGFISALFIENQDHRLYDRRRAEQILEVPVLGAVSEVQSGDR